MMILFSDSIKQLKSLHFRCKLISDTVDRVIMHKRIVCKVQDLALLDFRDTGIPSLFFLFDSRKTNRGFRVKVARTKGELKGHKKCLVYPLSVKPVVAEHNSNKLMVLGSVKEQSVISWIEKNRSIIEAWCKDPNIYGTRELLDKLSKI